MQFGTLDYAILLIYLAAMVGIGFLFAGRQKTAEDFFLAGRKMPWLAVAMSMYASLTSAITYLGLPGMEFRSNVSLLAVAVTNGWIEPEPRRELYAHIDAANVDLKAFTNRFYQQLCGGTLQPVLDTLLYLRRETPVHLEVTTLLIPGWNDSPAEIDAMTHWAVTNLGTDTPWHFSAYRPTEQWNQAPRTPLDTLLQAKAIAETNGLRNVHLGNQHLAA
jgi:hypothetical protein